MAAPRACALLERVGRDCGTEGRLIYSWWTFGVLASAPLRQLAAQEAAAADMLMIAAREGPGLPDGVSNWVRQWLHNKAHHPRRRVLVALLEPDKKQYGAPNGVLAELKELAALGAVDFIANGVGMEWELAPAVGRTAEVGECINMTATQKRREAHGNGNGTETGIES